MALEFKVGALYRRRDGSAVRVLAIHPDVEWPIETQDDVYLDSGEWLRCGVEHDHDIIADITETPPGPEQIHNEWVEYSGGHAEPACRHRNQTLSVNAVDSLCDDCGVRLRLAEPVVPNPQAKQVLAEADPTGRDAHAPGAKLDAGKLRAGLVLGDFSRALRAVAEVGTYGATKYTPHGWLSVPSGIERYEDAGERHRLERRCGIERDADTNLLHRAHEAWNVLATLELELRNGSDTA